MDQETKTLLADSDSESEWVKALCGATTESEYAFDRLFKMHRQRIFRFVQWYKSYCSCSIADDITEEVFLKVWLGRHKFDPNRGSFKQWVFGIACKTKLTFLRRTKHWLVTFTDLSNAEEEIRDLADPEDHAVRLEGKNDLNRFLDLLSEKQRQVLILKELEGNSYEEIAQMLEIPVGTVASRHHNAMKTLKETRISLFGE